MCGEEFKVVKVVMDHKSLENIFAQKDLTLRQRRWLELMSEYDFKVMYHLGKTNVVADALSKKPKVTLAHMEVLEWRVKNDI